MGPSGILLPKPGRTLKVEEDLLWQSGEATDGRDSVWQSIVVCVGIENRAAQ